MMSETKSVVRWNSEKGTITLDRGGAEERLILQRRGFWDGFFPEIVKSLGEDGVAVVMRALVKSLGISGASMEKPNFRTLIHCFDRRILPVDRQSSAVDPSVSWPVDDREITVFGDTVWILEDVMTIQHFKKVLTDVLSEKGAGAIIRNICRKGGIAVGDTALENYQWKDVGRFMASQDEKVYNYTFRVAGWSVARSVFEKGPDGNYMLVARCENTFESEGVTAPAPVCKILQHYMEGFYEGVLTKLADKSVESREVKCRSKGDGYCAFAFKVKEKKAGALDWDALADEWKALDAAMA
jgi:predicted hydrocarbon binding protein